MLSTDLVQGEVIIGVCPSLPVEGVAVTLGNYLVGGSGEKNNHLPWFSCLLPISERCWMKVLSFPKVFTACAMTRAMNHADSVSESGVGTSEVADYSVTCGPDLPFCFP